MINQNFIPYRQSRLEINLAKKEKEKKKNEAANDRRTFDNGVTNQMDLVADRLNGLVAKCDDDEHVALWSIDMIISLTLNGGN